MESRTGKGLRLISFDGGGIRSLSQLKIMENLMHRLEYKLDPDGDSDQEILPCECVEMMAGSDTGSIIALMFGKLRMSVREVLQEFYKICSEVYTGDLAPEIRTEKLKRCIEDLLQRRGLPIDLKLGKDKRITEQGCPCFVIATPKANMNSKVKLRTYRSRTEPSLDITLVDAVLATCATQSTFLPVSIGPELSRQNLIGGGMGMANPCRELILEAQDKFGGEAHISTIMSLGSGHLGSLTSPASGGREGWIDILRNMVENCERTAQEMETQIGHFDIYFRFSVEHGLQRLYGARAEDVSWLNTQAITYLQDLEVSRRLDMCIERLISRQDVITLEQLGLSSAPRVDFQSIQYVTRNLLVSAQDEKLLEALRPKGVTGGPPVEGCLEGTREDILQNIIDWIDDYEAPNIIWLKSHPGAGKTAIALTLVKRLRHPNRLGSSFFFQRANAVKLTPRALWCNAAFDLAYKDPNIRAALVTKLQSDRNIASTSDLDDLFQQIIVEPFLAAESGSAGNSSVIIVDALDECGGQDGPHSRDREELLRTLQRWPTLPRRFKLIVTSRGEDDIEHVLQSISQVIEITTGSNTRDKTWNDIRQFLTLRFEVIARPYSSLQPDWPGSNIIEELADRAGGLFIWARTVVEFIGRGAAEEQLSRILNQTSGMGNIAALYSQILKISFPEETNDIVEAFRSTLGAVIFAKIPLSLISLSNLLSIKHSRVEHICTKLKSVLHMGDTIQITHQSFVDFLIDPQKCPSAFYIRHEEEEQRLAMACLQAIRSNLRFNICELGSSCLLNSEVHNMKSRVERNIPDYVLYSCRYWIEHFVASRCEPEVLEYLQDFTENQFLFWLEVLSVTSQMNTASNRLSLLKSWMKKHSQDESTVTDMQGFTTTFASVMAQSAPHIYLSALPFAPRHSAVSKYYNHRYPGLINVERGGLEEWPRFECVIYGHIDAVSSVAISQDGNRIVSGSWDRTVRVWDAATGLPVGSPFKGHTDWIRSVAFSPDGTRIVSGSDDKTVRVWNAATGQLLGPSFRGHTGRIRSVAFSPDGTRIVSGSDDETVRIWNAATGQPLGAPFKGHTGWVTSVAFSPDGIRVVSGSCDDTVRVWDAATSQPLGAPFKGHIKLVNSAVFSLDGTRIVSGSNDKTVRVWNATTGQPLGTSFKGHSNSVTSVTFSPDGTRIVSGSGDKTLRVWDVTTGQPLGAPFEGHIEWVTSVAFSPNGTRIVSGSDDKTVRVWNAATGRALGAPFEGHTRWVPSVTFSPDGTRIVSGSLDMTLRVWDVTTGQPLGAPFEGHTGRIRSAAFSPDGTRIVSESDDRTVRVWDAATGQLLGLPFTEYLDWVAFSLDGTRVVSGSDDNTVPVWNAARGQPLRQSFVGYIEWVSSIAFSPDGTRIVSGSADKTVRAWDAMHHRLGARYSERVASAALSPDGTYIVSGSGDGMVRMWDMVTYDTEIVFKSRSDPAIVEGWVLNSNSERLFWILPSLQAGLWLPASGVTLGNYRTKVNMERFQYGERWTRCQQRAPDM